MEKLRCWEALLKASKKDFVNYEKFSQQIAEKDALIQFSSNLLEHADSEGFNNILINLPFILVCGE